MTTAQAANNWRNLMGLLFSVVVANFFLGCLGVILRFSSEWYVQYAGFVFDMYIYVCVCVINNSCIPTQLYTTITTQTNEHNRGIVTREYFAGANSMGPYLLARFLGLLPLSYGPFILALLVYWMTGESACVYMRVHIFMA